MVDLQAARSPVVNKSQFPKFIHEHADARTRRPDHVRKRVLRDLGQDQGLGAPLIILRQQQQRAGQAPLAGIEEMIDQILLDPMIPRQEVLDETRAYGRFFFQDFDHLLLLDHVDRCGNQSDRGGEVGRSATDATFSEKITGSQKPQDAAPAALGHQHQFHDTHLDVVNVRASILLRENRSGSGILDGARRRQRQRKIDTVLVRRVHGSF